MNWDFKPFVLIVAFNSGVTTKTYNNGQGFFCRGVWLDPAGSVFDRLDQYIRKIEEIRQQVWRERRNHPWTDMSLTKEITVIDPAEPHYLRNMTIFSHVLTVFLRFADTKKGLFWNSFTDNSNLLIQEYYEWAADPRLCRFMTDKKSVSTRWSWGPFCSSEKRATLSRSPLHVEFLNTLDHVASLSNPYFHPHIDQPPPYVTYMSIIQDAILTEAGSVISKNVKIYPSSCGKKEDLVVPEKYLESPLYREVLSIAQFWGFAVYHNNVESIPRIAPYIEFLRRNPEIKLHVGEIRGDFTAEILEIAGLPTNRLIKGVVRAKVVYFPEGTTCGFAHVQNTQLLSHKYRVYIKDVAGHQDRRSVVVIRRTRKRYFSKTTEVENMVQKVTAKYGLNFEIFPDNPAPSILESMKMFNRAVLVFAPHGAGLFNLVFCEPGTFVIETVCSHNLVNMCYLRMAHSLGHRYYGYVAKTTECLKGMEVDVKELENVVDFYMPYALKLANKQMQKDNTDIQD